MIPKPTPRKTLKRKAATMKKSARAILRETVIVRDGLRCRACHGSVGFLSAHVHEVVYRSRGGDPLDPKCCITLCPRCHREVHEHKVSMLMLDPAQGTDGVVEVRPWTDKPSVIASGD